MGRSAHAKKALWTGRTLESLEEHFPTQNICVHRPTPFMTTSSPISPLIQLPSSCSLIVHHLVRPIHYAPTKISSRTKNPLLNAPAWMISKPQQLLDLMPLTQHQHIPTKQSSTRTLTSLVVDWQQLGPMGLVRRVIVSNPSLSSVTILTLPAGSIFPYWH